MWIDLVVIDLINVHEDMAGKSGSLVGPDIKRYGICLAQKEQGSLSRTVTGI